MNNTKTEKVIAYIDGFNLYFGMREAGLHECRWLNVQLLVGSLLKPNQQLNGIKYFTSRVRNNPEKVKRQSTYLDALGTLPIHIIYGNYQNNTEICHRCGHTWLNAKEKMTDVNIATHMIVDAHNNEYDRAILISGDSDLVPPINAIHQIFQNKSVFVAFPPKRHNVSLANIANGSMMIGRKKLKDSLFSDIVISKTGYELKCPEKWKN